MPFNGSGTASPPNPPTFPAVSGQVIEAAKFNAIINDLYACLTQVIAKDGQTVITGTLQWADAAANLLALGGVSSTAAQTVNGVKTFAASPKSLVAAADATELLRKGEFDTAVASLTSVVDGKAPAAGNAAQVFSVANASAAAHSVPLSQFAVAAGSELTFTIPGVGSRLIVKVGRTGASSINTNGGTRAVVFGTAFPLNCFAVFPALADLSDASGVVNCYINSRTTTGFTAQFDNSDTRTATVDLHWIAIGY